MRNQTMVACWLVARGMHVLTGSAGWATELVRVMTLEHDALFGERAEVVRHERSWVVNLRVVPV